MGRFERGLAKVAADDTDRGELRRALLGLADRYGWEACLWCGGPIGPDLGDEPHVCLPTNGKPVGITVEPVDFTLLDELLTMDGLR